MVKWIARPELPPIFAKLRRISRILWVRIALILALSVIAALSAKVLDPLIPQAPKDRFSEAATIPILNILANGMLAVATFSLGVMVSSHRTMAEQTTPRIHSLLLEDTSTQSMLATFIGAFAFALSSIILFRAGYYNESASVIVFAMTVFVVAAIIVSLVRWIYQLSRIGSMDYALERAEETAREALDARKSQPNLGAHDMDDSIRIPESAKIVCASSSGFLKRIEMQSLHSLAEEAEGRIFIDVLPGDRILTGQALAKVDGEIDEADVEDCFVLDSNRSYEQDPRYAIQTLRETASKALSPGINDPGTAVEIIVRLERLLWDCWRSAPEDQDVVFDWLYLKPLRNETLIDIAFRDIARDGAGFADVLIGISKALSTLSETKQVSKDRTTDLQTAIDQFAEVGLQTEAERERYQTRNIRR